MAKEKDASLVKLRESASERERQLLSELQAMSSKLEDSSVKLRQLEWNVQDLEKEKTNIVTR
jgi:flagellar biosynthesis chaperone FliJ